jgi:glycosyltransferase involved in cell wall biosynthesis/peptidoglycan/xylan/chitin deacetylase (PgdA/CDA1 family)/SAM-dependent methyltransferase
MFSRLTGQWLTGCPAVRDGHAPPPSAPTMSASVDNTISYPPFADLTDPSPAVTSGVSVIIPVHNAATTLEATLNSMVHQTYVVWEAIIIDDGSTDGTRALAEGWAHRDKRFHVLQQERSGVSAARNRGLREARYSFVLFLDGDDRIAPAHLERMVGKLSSDCTLDAVHCGRQNILASGVSGRSHEGSAEGDLFQYFAFHCHFAIHACVLRRDLALAVGGFDASLATCEDWDFFQRVARTGARFGRVPEVLAFYHIRADSASRDGRRCVTDARVVLDRGHRRDPRVRIAAKAYFEGGVATGRDLALYNIVMYWAFQEIGAGRDRLSLLDFEDLPPAPDLQAAAVAEIIQELVPMAANRSEEDWPSLWSRVSAPLATFLARLEAKARVPALAFATLRHLEKKILLADPGDAPLLVGSTYRVSVDLAGRLRDVSLPPQADRLICRLTLKGEPIGAVELPSVGVVAGRRIAEAALEGRGRLLFRRALTPERSVRLSLKVLRGLLRRRMLRLIYCAVTAKPEDRLDAARRVKHEAAIVVKANLSRVLAPPPGVAARQANQNWQKSVDAATAAGRAAAREQLGPPKSPDWWDRFFALPDPWAYESDYEAVKFEQTLALLPEEVITDALEIACAEGHFTVRLAPRVGRLTAVDISPRALARAQARCDGRANVAFRRLDLNADDIPGPLDLIVCSEVLYYVRDLAGVLGRILSQIRPSGFFLTVHSRVLIDEPGGIGFAWNQACGVETIAKTITAQPGIALRRELRTPLYRVLLYQRIAPGQPPGPPEIGESDRMGQMIPAAYELARWPGPPERLAAKRTCSVPILMYHRIAADGPVALARFRVAPDLFAAQIATLHRAGYRAVGFEDWINAMMRNEPLPGKPIILSFDDGYQDFLTAAMPVLRYYGFSATVFLVAERISGVADWDAGYGEAAPLLSWQEVRALQAAGTEFGCHSAVHRPMTGMYFAEVTEDTARARAILEEGLEAAVTTLAYPYGAENELVRRVVADLGFRAAASCEPGINRLGDDPLRLRRVEIFGGCAPEQLLTLIGHTSEKDLSDALPAQ